MPEAGVTVDSKICSHEPALADLIWGALPERFLGMGLNPFVASHEEENKQETGK